MLEEARRCAASILEANQMRHAADNVPMQVTRSSSAHGHEGGGGGSPRDKHSALLHTHVTMTPAGVARDKSGSPSPSGPPAAHTHIHSSAESRASPAPHQHGALTMEDMIHSAPVPAGAHVPRPSSPLPLHAQPVNHDHRGVTASASRTVSEVLSPPRPLDDNKTPLPASQGMHVEAGQAPRPFETAESLTSAHAGSCPYSCVCLSVYLLPRAYMRVCAHMRVFIKAASCTSAYLNSVLTYKTCVQVMGEKLPIKFGQAAIYSSSHLQPFTAAIYSSRHPVHTQSTALPHILCTTRHCKIRG
jgi:hypothetical protein